MRIMKVNFQEFRTEKFVVILFILIILTVELLFNTLLTMITTVLKTQGIILLSNSQNFRNLIVLSVSKLVTIVFLIYFGNYLLSKQKEREFTIQHSFRFVSILFILYISLTPFIMVLLLNFNIFFANILGESNIQFGFVPIDSQIMNLSYLIVLFVFLVILIPVLQELLFRKWLIDHLSYLGYTTGLLIILSTFMYSVTSLFQVMVEQTLAQAVWSFGVKLFSGCLLAIVYLHTRKVKFTIIFSGSFQFIGFIQILAVIHPDFIPLGPIINFLIGISVRIGQIIILLLIFDIFVRRSNSLLLRSEFVTKLFIIKNTNRLITVRWIILSINILFVFPNAIALFIDNLILYTDVVAIILKGGSVILIFLVLIIILGREVLQFNSLDSLSSVDSPDKTIFLKNEKSFRSLLLKNIGIFFLLLGTIFPFFVAFITALISIDAFVVLNANANADLIFGQSPLFSYSKLVNKLQTTFFLLNSTQIDEQFNILQDTNNNWYFFPSTYMSQPGDWIHGLLTVTVWFLFFVFLYFTIKWALQGKKRRVIFSTILVIVTEFLWILLSLGLGSIPAEDGSQINQVTGAVSPFFQTEIIIQNFLILPIGLFFFLGAILIFLAQGIYNKYIAKTQPKSNNLISD